MSSTGNVLTVATRHAPGIAINVMLMPISVPARLFGTIWDVTSSQVHGGLLSLHEHFIGSDDLNSLSSNGGTMKSSSSPNNLLDWAGSMVPMIQSVAMHAKNEIGSSVWNLLGMSSLQNDTNLTLDCLDSDISNTTCSSTDSTSSDEDNSSSEDQEGCSAINVEDVYSIRICDHVFQSKHGMSNYITLKSSDGDEQKILMEELFFSMTERALQLVEDNIRFDSIQTGTGDNIDHLIHWKEVGSSVKLMKKNQDNWTSPNALRQLETEVLLWTGRFNSACLSYGKEIPLFKARGIIPNKSPLQLMELLYDSAQCQKYNRYSNGRKDICILESDPHSMCKIVENETKIPLTGRVIQMKVLMFVKPLVEGGYIIISRSVHNGQFNITPKIGKQNEIIWSINILRCIDDPLKTDLTVMTQANTSMIPLFFAEKVSQ